MIEDATRRDLPAELLRFTLAPEWMQAEADDGRRQFASDELMRRMRDRNPLSVLD